MTQYYTKINQNKVIDNGNSLPERGNTPPTMEVQDRKQSKDTRRSRDEVARWTGYEDDDAREPQFSCMKSNLYKFFPGFSLFHFFPGFPVFFYYSYFPEKPMEDLEE